MLSGLDALLQAAQFLELQEQQHRPAVPHRLSSEVSIIPTTNNPQQQNGSANNSNNSVHTTSVSNNTISFIPSNSNSSVTASVSENRFLPPIGKISNGTVILTASGISGGGSVISQNGLISSGSSAASSPARILSPISGGSASATATAMVAGLVPQGTTAYLTTTTINNNSTSNQSSIGATVVSSTTSSPRHQSAGSTAGAAIIPLISGSRKRTISNASSHSSGGYVKDEPLVNGHSTAPPLVVISTNGSSSNSIISSSSSIHQKQHHAAVSSLTIDLSTKSNSSSGGVGIGHRLSSTPPSSGCSSSSSTLTISPVDDSQSSLNLSGGSTSGYITSHSANSSSSLNLSGSSPGLSINGGSVIGTTSSHGPNSSPLPHDLVIVQQQQQIGHLVQAGQPHHGLTSTATLLSHIPTGGRRRTTSSNSNGSVGTREVHNKLEKNRRAHLKECFEQLKKQLTLQPDEKKTSNLSILHAAIRHIQLLKRKEREYEHEMERLAKEKIASQNRILLLKRELSQWGDVDFSRLAPDTDAIPNGSNSNNNGSSSSSSITSTSSTMANSNGVLSDRDLLNDPPGIAPGRNGIRYSSSSSLSSVATTASIGNLPLQTTISPVLIAASSPSRASPPSLSLNRNSSSPAATSGSMPMPLSLTTKSSPAVSETHNSTPSPLKFSTGITSLPNGLNLSTSSNGLINGGSSSSGGGSNCSTPNSISGSSIGGINGTPLPLIVNANNIGSLSQSQLFTPVTATILTTGNGTALQTLPLNLNVTSSIANGHHPSSIVSTSNGMTSTASGLQIIGTTANGTTIPAGLISSATGKELINGTTLPRNGFRTDSNKIEIIATQSAAGSALEPPATKVIKLVNGNTLDKMMLSQVVQQGGLVMSPIQLLTPQGLRVIQQAPNGLATIELSTPANVQPQSNQTQRTTGGNSISSSNLSHLTSSQPSSRHPQQQTHIQSMTGAQLHKLLISSTNSSTSNGITTISSAGTTTGYSNGSSPIMTTTITPELARLPGGAELNILPAGTNGATALPLYRTTGHGGKLTFVNAISTGNGTGLTLKGTDTSTSGTGRTAVHVVTPIQTSTAAQLSGLTPVVVSRYDQDTGHVLGSFTTSTAGPQQTAQLGKVGALVSRN